MDCANAREAISALLDAEPLEVDTSELAVHVAGCESCHAWRESAHEITRRMRLAPARPAPTANRALMAAVREEMHRGARIPRGLTTTRCLLAVIAVAQIALTLPVLISGSDHEAPIHVAHEMGSFGMALAAGFLIVVWQPGRARGMHALVGVAALLLLITAAIDLVAGRTSLSDEAPHLLVLAGWLLMYRIAAQLPLDVDSDYGQEFRRQRVGAVFEFDASTWQSGSGRAPGAEAPAAQRRAASS